MSSTILQIVSFNILTLLLMTPNNIKAQQCTDETDYCWSCSYSGTFTNTSTYKQNLENLLSSFTNSSNSNNYGFYNSSRGENSDRVNAIALCIGDMVPDDCRTCVGDVSTKLLQQYCPNRQEAIIWGWSCMVRYSNNPIFSIWEDYPMQPLSSPNFSEDEEKYTKVLNPFLDELRIEAASGNSTTKLAYGRRNVLLSHNSVEPIFALLQCTPDLSRQNCSGCLQHSISQIPSCCNGSTGARVLKPSCTLRFERQTFFNFLTDDSPQPQAQGKRSNSKRKVVIIVVTSIIAMILAISSCIFFIRRKTLKTFRSLEKSSLMESLQIDFRTVEAATDNFSDANKLGEGGFGPVYKGILSNGQYIAVKRLSKTSGQGDLEFKNEVVLVANLQHQNLVRLIGFCLEGIERLLVYEFVPNGSLNQFLFDPAKRRGLDWYRRYKIIEGIARGLVYLHEYSRIKIIHRDLKASNILLDDEMNPKIADFGLARLIALDQTHENTSRIMGTYGYMAPEYAMRGHFSIKSDVYSFGVLLMEIVSGQKSTFLESEDASDLLTHVWKNWTEGTALNVVDSTMQMMRDGKTDDDDGSRSREIKKCIHIAVLCVQENPADRPTMNSITAMLTTKSDINLPIPAPSQPRNFVYSSNSMTNSQSNYSEN